MTGDNEQFEYARLMQSMEMVGFSRDKMSKSTRVLSAVLHLGNLDFSKRYAIGDNHHTHYYYYIIIIIIYDFLPQIWLS